MNYILLFIVTEYTMLCYATQYGYAVQYYTILYDAILYYAMLYYTFYSMTHFLFYAMLGYIMLPHAMLSYDIWITLRAFLLRFYSCVSNFFNKY